MKYLLTGCQMKRADQYTIEHIGIPSMVLMERAAMEVVKKLEEACPHIASVLVVCGHGNNGGDGYAIARLLYQKGYDVSLAFVGNETKRTKENRCQKEICEYYQIPVKQNFDQEEYSVIIDAVLGTGISRPIEGELSLILEKLNQMKGYKLAVDLPSGIHDETGLVMGAAFRADLTVALAFLKRGHVMISGNLYVGKVVVADIGIYPDAIHSNEKLTYCFEPDEFYQNFPKRKEQSHKGTYGRVLLIVGSQGMAGAALLCARAAYAVGAGLVQIYTHEDNRCIIQKSLPEAIVSTYNEYQEKQLRTLLDWADVVLIGCGLGMSDTAKKLVEGVLINAEMPCVVDADALNILSQNIQVLKERTRPTILTPHMKEMARILGCEVPELFGDKFTKLHNFVTDYPVTCILKDARTLVEEKDEPIFLNLTGNAAMAKGGAGDVLAGMVSGILAQGAAPYESACMGVYLHGMAGDYAMEQKGRYSVLASDIVEGITQVLRQI